MKKLLALLITCYILVGCAIITDHMNPADEDQQTKGPENGKALVHFMRPYKLTTRLSQATIYDGDTYIGTISADKRLAYQAEPGKHLFMVIGENADFMQAELLADKTYYVKIDSWSGFWKPRYGLIPLSGVVPQAEIDEYYASTQEVKVNGAGIKWAMDKQLEIQQRKADFFPDWLSTSDEKKQSLRPESGI
jgi:hypothetical protein